MTVPASGFISYAHDDYTMFQAFRRHLRATERRFGIRFWADPAINAGYHWDAVIQQKIDEAGLFILLVSAAFIGSDYIWDNELPAIKKRCATVKGLVLPVVLRRSAWQMLHGVLQAVPTERGAIKPIEEWHRRNDGYDRAREQIDGAISNYYGVPLASMPWPTP
jgi:internalin A